MKYVMLESVRTAIAEVENDFDINDSDALIELATDNLEWEWSTLDGSWCDVNGFMVEDGWRTDLGEDA